MDGFVLGSRGISRRIEIIDLNYGGCGISTPIELEVGEKVKLTVPGRGSVPAEVCWYEEGRAGLVFEPVSQTPPNSVQRSAVRRNVAGKIELGPPGRDTYDVDVQDLSTDGCKVSLAEPPSVGDPMLVKFDGLEAIAAKVAWVEAKMAGLQFDRAVHPAVLDLLVARLRTDRP
jgi:hypothetical protein